MPIQEANIVFVESQVMDDVPEGGGAATGRVITDGQMNNVFEDISDLDRAYGRFNLRKIFLAVRTLSTDLYGGAKTVVTALPTDDALGYTLFSNKDAFDTRDDAANKVEAYLYKGPTWGGYLLENHIAGMRAINLIQRVGTDLPPVGRTLCLVQDEGLAGEREQYVRVTKATAVERVFNSGTDEEFTRWVVTLDLSDALRTDFNGFEPTAFDSKLNYSGKTRVRDTTVADATRYYGAQRLKTAAAIGDLSVRADSIYTRLVPSAQTELPVAAALPHAAAALPIPGAESITYTASHDWTPSIALYLPGGAQPGSVSIAAGGVTITDDGGELRTTTGAVGAIDYANGILTLATSSFSGSKTVTYRPAAQVQRAPQSSEIPITQETRSLSYAGQIIPLPQPGTLAFSFRAQGRWYVLQEQGNGTIKGLEASMGAGTFDKSSGGYTITLGALPDVGSSIVVTWNVPAQETAHATATLKASQTIGLDLAAAEMVQPGSLTLSWMEGITAKTATAGTNLELTGGASGAITATGDAVEFAPNTLPAVGAQITVDYTVGPKQEDSFSHPSRDGQGKVPVTATLGAIAPGTLEVEWNTLTDESLLGVYTRDQLREMGIDIVAPVDPIHIARDDGNGNVVLNGAAIGTVNYATGAVLFNPDRTISIPSPQYTSRSIGGAAPAFVVGAQWDGTFTDTERFRLNYNGISYVQAPSLYPNDMSGWVKLRYNAPGATTARQKVVTFEPSFRLVPEVAAQVVAGSVVLRFGASGTPIGDSGQGVLREPTSGGYVTRGALDYVGGTVSLTSWTTGVANSIVRAACVTTVGEVASSAYVFRTANAPLRPGSVSISYATASAGTLVATADTDGVISGTGMFGTVDYEMGIVRIAFGARVLAAGNESEPWYDARLVGADGKIFKPQAIAMSTLRYSAVSYTYLPLDANVLGIDPVRLPSDGRVPIYRPGDVVMVMHAAETAPATVANGGTIDCGRTRIGWVRVIDATGASKPSGYTLDRATGIVTFTDVSGMTMPVKVRHTVGDLRQITDAQITGQLTLARPLTHAYPAGESVVASCLIHGDRRARVSAVWDQATWNGTWSDSLVGSEATATLDTIAHPITVTNEGAETERWLLRWTSTTNVELIGQRRGLVFSGPFTADIAPINPRTRNQDGTGGAPYLRIPLAANGGGWSTGNVVRINTVGALADIWIARSIQQSDEPLGDGADGVELYALGNIDRP